MIVPSLTEVKSFFPVSDFFLASRLAHMLCLPSGGETRMELDRISLNFHGPAELALAQRLRTLAGKHGINRLVKQALRQYLDVSPRANQYLS